MYTAAVLIWACLATGDVREYARPLDAGKLDQAAFDAESYGDKKALKRETDGLHVTVAPGGPETGWKLPQALKIGGDFTITARFRVRKLPKPAQDDGVAVGLALATQSTDQPDVVLVRVIEPAGQDVYRSVEKAGGNNNPMQQNMMMEAQPRGPAAKPIKPPRKTFPARGEGVVMEFRRVGQVVSLSVTDAVTSASRYLGQVPLGPSDIGGVKLFASNRNGAEAIDVVFQEVTVRAERISGLGTEVRTVFGRVVHGEPIGLENGTLLLGAPGPANPAQAAGNPQPAAQPAASAARRGVSVIAAQPGGPAGAVVVMVEAAPAAAPPAPAASPAPPATTIAPNVGPSGVTSAAVPNANEKDKARGGAATPKPAEKPKPRERIPLEVVESIEYERASAMSGRVVGQPNLDFTMGRGTSAAGKGDTPPAPAPAPADDAMAAPPGTVTPARVPKVDPKPNGIRDLHLSLSNLSPSPIRQATVNVQTDKGQTAWRLDTSNSNDWPLVVRRAGTETWADLFLEPPPGEIKGKDFTVNLTYENGQSGNATVKSEVSADPKLAFDAKAPAPTFDARVHLTGGEQLFGRFEGLGDDAVRLRTPWGDALVVPLTHVAGIYMGLPEHKESVESFDRRLRTRGTEDLLLARSKEGEVVAIPGVAEKTDGDRLLFHFQEKTRALSLKQVEGLVLAARPEPAQPDVLRATFSLAGGLVVAGKWAALDEKTWKVESSWGQTLALPAGDVRRVRLNGGQMTSLSDLDPVKVEQTPYFGRRMAWRKDVNLAGGPLRIDGRTYERGIAAHSRTALTYDIGGGYALFEAVVGFDESAGQSGRVDCRVFADDRELYVNADLRADAPPVKLRLPVAGAERLRLVVDFGAGEDTGDRVIWADPRLFRKPPPSAPAAEAPAQGEPATKSADVKDPKAKSGGAR